MRKRRSTLVAIFMANVALTPLIAACGPSSPSPAKTESKTVYSDLAGCVSETGNKDACEKAFKASAAEHDKTAPRFTAKAQCEAEYGTGNCESKTSSDGSSSFMPYMMGYMLGSMGNGGGYSSAYPVYYSSRGNVYSGRYGEIGRVDPSSVPRRYSDYTSPQRTLPRSSPITVRSSSPVASSTGTVTRGGFGATASARGGCCG